MENKDKHQLSWQQGSITVFLTLILVLILALVTVSIEHVRFLTANSHVLMAADPAAMTVYGNYNKELYEEYGFFAYGGYNGIALNGFLTEFQDTLEKNLAEAPEDSSRNYTALYRIKNLSVEAESVTYLTEEEAFYRQVEDYLKAELLSDFLDSLLEQFKANTGDIDSEEMQKNLDTTSQYEHGEFQVSEETAESSPTPTTTASAVANAVADAEASVVADTETNAVANMADAEDDHAGGNPLESFRQLLRDGMLALVCDEKKLSQESVEQSYSNSEQGIQKSGKEKSDSAADLLKELLGGESSLTENHLLDSSMIQKTTRKGELLCYADQVFSCFGNDKNKTLSYAMEYLASGEKQERDNLQKVIQKILVFRTAMNYLYTQSDPALQSESLATATSIAAALAVPVLVTAIQQTILLILAVEESLIDITALLEGRSVPIMKNAATFQMTYLEICMASKALFQQKAKKYSKDSATLKAGFMSYKQYLIILLLLVSEKNLRLRSYDVMQYDLRKRFNSSFSLEQCNCGIQYQLSYDMPFVFGNLLQHDGANGVISRSLSSCYQYQ